MRFRRESRLVDKRAFSRVFERASRSRDTLFTVLYRDNGTSAPRLGLAIGKRHCPLATRRNRLKRLIRESFRAHRANLDGIDIVVLNQPAATRASNPAVFASLAKHWRRIEKALGRPEEAGSR